MHSYHLQDLKSAFASIIRAHITPGAYDWLNEKIQSFQNASQLNTAIVMLPRKTGKSPVIVNKQQSDTISKIRPNLILKDWTVDRLARMWLLLHADATDREKYYNTIENLFPSAEVNELIALYSA